LAYLPGVIIYRNMRADTGGISTRPTSKDWRGYIVGFLTFTAIASILPLILLQFHYVNTPAGTAPSSQIVGVVVLSAFVSFWFCSRLVNRNFWCLTQSELIGGITGKIRYPLSSIEQIIIGLPSQMPIPGTALASPALKENYVERQAASLLVKFRDGTLLPLKLRAMANGAELMDELVNRLSDRVVRNYVYSEKEIKRLRGAFLNISIRKG
jgi:hypothetical protein